jgi:hypothetical protein
VYCSRAVAYCRQPASTVTLGIEPRWDPWPYICSVSRLLFFSSFVVPPLIKGRGWTFFYNCCSLTTPYSTRGHIEVSALFCGRQSGAGAGFLWALRFPLPIFIPPIAPQSPSSIIWGLYNRPEVAAVPSGLSPTPLIIIIIIIIINNLVQI